MHRHKSLHLSLFVQTITSLGVNVTICYSVSVLTGLTSFTKVDFIAGIVVLHCIRCICNSVDVACLPTVFNNDRLNIQKKMLNLWDPADTYSVFQIDKGTTRTDI